MWSGGRGCGLVVFLALLPGAKARAANGSLSVDLGAIRCPTADQLLPVLRARLPGRTIQLTRSHTARPLLKVELGSAEVLHVSLTLTDGRVLRRDLSLSSGQCAAAADTIGFLTKSWFEQVPMLSPEAPVGAVAAGAVGAGATATTGAAKTTPKVESVGNLTPKEEAAAAVPEDLALPIVPGEHPAEAEVAPEAPLVPVVVVVGDNPIPESQKTITQGRPAASDATHLSLLVDFEGAISSVGTFGSIGVSPTVRVGLGPHWSIAVSGTFSTKATETVSDAATSPPTQVPITLQRTSAALWAGYQFFPQSRWGLEVFAGPELEYWSTHSDVSAGFTDAQSQTLWQPAIDLGARGSVYLARSLYAFLSFEINVLPIREILYVGDSCSGGSAGCTTTPLLWFSLAAGMAYDFF